MAEHAWKALSIRQPWIDLILSGLKTIEVREWEIAPNLRGTFLLHAAYAFDWKTIALLNIAPEFGAARGAFVGRADLVNVIELSADTNWREHLDRHRVIHPPVGNRTVYGLALENVRRFSEPVRAPGAPYFFPVRSDALQKLAPELG
jgi:hypothetical protein